MWNTLFFFSTSIVPSAVLLFLPQQNIYSWISSNGIINQNQYSTIQSKVHSVPV